MCNCTCHTLCAKQATLFSCIVHLSHLRRGEMKNWSLQWAMIRTHCGLLFLSGPCAACRPRECRETLSELSGSLLSIGRGDHRGTKSSGLCCTSQATGRKTKLSIAQPSLSEINIGSSRFPTNDLVLISFIWGGGTIMFHSKILTFPGILTVPMQKSN